MKTSMFVSLVMTVVLFRSAAAQGDFVQVGSQAYDVPVDARSVAMGESSVALRGNQNALMFNPAGLGGIRGAHVSYSLRRFDWTTFLDKAKYLQVSGVVETPYVNAGFSYNRLKLGEVIVSTPQFPEGTGTAEIFDYMLALGFGKRLGDNWDVGIGLKTYDICLEKLSGDVPVLETTKPFLVDLGFIYSSEIANDQPLFTHSFSVGAAIQNLGGKLKSENSSFSGREESETSLPQYVRVGFTFTIGVSAETGESLQTFSVLASGEYRTFLNGSDGQSHQKDFWGFGLEMKAMEIVSVRLSGFVNPYSSVYGTKGVPALRYGFGISLPFQKLGTSLPITIQIDYAGIPPQISNSYIGSQEPKTMHAFSMSVAYENEIF